MAAVRSRRRRGAASANTCLLYTSSSGGGADSAEVEKLKEDAATLATALVDLTDDYIVIDNTVFTPASRVISTDGGTIELDRASYENGIITLE